jgi:hypothetical protein
LRRNCLLQQAIEGKVKGRIEMTERRWRCKKLQMTLRKGKILTSEEGSSRSHYVESSLWKRLWTCETDC